MKTIRSKLWSVVSGNQFPAAAAADGTKTKVSPTSSGDTINHTVLTTSCFSSAFFKSLTDDGIVEGVLSVGEDANS
jgi:hypothetical protein